MSTPGPFSDADMADAASPLNFPSSSPAKSVPSSGAARRQQAMRAHECFGEAGAGNGGTDGAVFQLMLGDSSVDVLTQLNATTSIDMLSNLMALS